MLIHKGKLNTMLILAKLHLDRPLGKPENTQKTCDAFPHQLTLVDYYDGTQTC